MSLREPGSSEGECAVTPMEVLSPTSWSEAALLLQESPETSAVLAGGTDLMSRIRGGKVSPAPRRLVSLRAIPSMGTIWRADDGSLHLHARTTLAQIAADPAVRETYPALHEACASIGSPQIRARATLVGNVCGASPAADGAVAALCFSGTAEVVDDHSAFDVPLVSFFTGPRRTCLKPGQIVRALRFPPPSPRSGSAFRRVSTRQAMDCAAVILAASVALDATGRIESAEIALGSVAPTPIRATEAETRLLGQAPLAAGFAEAARIASATCEPISDIRASAEYRRKVVCRVLPLVLQQAVERAMAAERQGS